MHGKRIMVILVCLSTIIFLAGGCMTPARGDSPGPQSGNPPTVGHGPPDASGRGTGAGRVIVTLEGIPFGEDAQAAVRQYVDRHVTRLSPEVRVVTIFRLQPSFVAEVTPRGRSQLARLPGVRRVANDDIDRALSRPNAPSTVRSTGQPF